MDLETPCIWSPHAPSIKGYSRVRLGGTRHLAHRVAYEAVFGPIPVGMVVDHGCHNADSSCAGGPTCAHRRCVNPEHLELVTPAENNRRGRVNATKTSCKRGHVFDEQNTYMDPRGLRQCRTCDAARKRARYWAVATTA